MKFKLRLVMALMLTAAAPATASQRLTGAWAGEGFVMRSVPSGTVVQGICGSGKISRPILLNSVGAFAVAGYFNL